MWFSSWLGMRRRSAPSGPRPRPRQHSAPLGVRQLETRLTPSMSTLASFGFAPAGASPQAGLVMDGSGNLYGTAYSGGPSNAGTVFEIAHGSGTLSVLASFDGSNGANPFGTLILDSSGNLYGTTLFGGASGFGTVFEV